IVAAQAQQEPLLFLADTQGVGVVAHQTGGQPVAQPTAGTGQYLHILGMETYLFVKLTVEGLLGSLIGIDATLGKLPGVLTANTSGPEQLPPVIGENNAHIRAESVVIYHGCILEQSPQASTRQRACAHRQK